MFNKVPRSREEMGDGYNHQLHHRSTYLPMMCSRLSIKDVHHHLPNKWEHRSASSSDEPSSPRVSCMGQVKRSNRVVGFPTPNYRLTTATTPNNIKYHKTRKSFSGKNLPTAAASRRGMIVDSARRSKLRDDDNKNYYAPVNIAELDPPLPVVKRVQPPADGRDEVNLWKRRSSGVALKSLQLQQIHIPSNHCIQPTTV